MKIDVGLSDRDAGHAGDVRKMIFQSTATNVSRRGKATFSIAK